MSKVYQSAITTHDNPYDPFEDFMHWQQFDKEKGYCSNEKIARIANITDDMTDLEEIEEIDRAIDVLISLDFTNTYKKIKKELNWTVDEPLE